MGTDRGSGVTTECMSLSPMGTPFIGEKGKFDLARACFRCTGTILDEASQAEYLVEARVMKPIKRLHLKFMSADAWCSHKN